MTLNEKITTKIDATPEYSVKGNTTEQVVAYLVAHPDVDPWPIIRQLNDRFIARAARREAKADAE